MSARAQSTRGGNGALRSEVPPEPSGSIRRRDLSAADWRFLLPSLDFGRVLVFGAPSRGMLAGVAMLAREVAVITPDEGALAEAREAIRTRGLPNVRATIAGESKTLPFPDGAFDLVVSREADGGSGGMTDPGRVDEIDRLLTPDGLLYLETASLGEALRLPGRTRQFSRSGMKILGRFWLVQRAGQIWAALPLNGKASPVERYFFDHVLHGTSRKGRLLGAISHSSLALRLLPWVLSGRGVLLQKSTEPAMREPAVLEPAIPARPFAHLKAEGNPSGQEEDADHIGFFAKGAYDSNKVTFFRFGPSRSAPDVIVKMTRSSAYNHRLEAEHRALSELEERALVHPSSYPRALFLRHHQGLAVLGQKVIDGSPFRTRTTGRSDCPYARAAIEWIQQLGAGSRDATSMTTPPVGDMAERFTRLLDTFGSTYRITAAERHYLSDRIRRLRRIRRPFPLVFRHGDAGTWNIMVTRDDRVAFLDWEASETQGPPLWDLFDFLRSFGNWLGRIRGDGDNLSNYERGFLRSGALSDLQVGAVERYCTAVGIEREMVEPLFFACWMQRALREAEWTQDALEKGTYINLIRLCIRERRAPGLRSLFR